MKNLVRFGIVCLCLLGSVSVFAQDDRLQIVATHSILGDVVQNVAGDVVDIVITMPAGTDPHSFEPVPSDIIALADADVVFINGAFFEEGLLEAIENADTDMNIVTVSDCIPMLGFEHEDDHHDDEHEDDHHDDEHEDDHHDGEHEDDHHDDEHEDDHHEREELCEDHTSELSMTMDSSEALGALYTTDCDAGHNHSDDEEHDHGACDPHVWMTVDNVMLWVLMIRDTLIEFDSANADTYTANADSYLQSLTTLRDEIQPLVDSIPQENRVLVTNHDSLGYFASEYGFEIITTIIAGGSTVAEPSVADIANIIDVVRERDVTAIFAENTLNDATAQTIADETGVNMVILYSGSLSDADAPANTYLDYMRYNVTTIASALAG